MKVKNQVFGGTYGAHVLYLPWPKPSTPVGDCVMASDLWCLARSSCLYTICRLLTVSSGLFLDSLILHIPPNVWLVFPRSVSMDMWSQHQVWVPRWAHPFDMAKVAYLLLGSSVMVFFIPSVCLIEMFLILSILVRSCVGTSSRRSAAGFHPPSLVSMSLYYKVVLKG